MKQEHKTDQKIKWERARKKTDQKIRQERAREKMRRN